MKASFADVLAQEVSVLAGVTDTAGLARWRRRLVEQVISPQSPYATVVQQVGDPRERAAFLDRWRDLIASALGRLHAADALACAEIDVQQAAVSILAALYGGAVLSRVAKDVRPLHVSLDLSLAPLLPGDAAAAWADRGGTVGTMDA